jgi:invasion protein IalB
MLGRGVTIGILLGLVLLNSAFAQNQGQSQPKTALPKSAPAATEEPAPPPGWVVNCASTQAGLDCRAGQTIFLKKTGQRLLAVAVRMPAESKKPVMLLQVPLGIYLPAGISLQFGKDPARKLVVQSCNQGGCVAEYSITDAELAAMLKGADLTVVVQSAQKREPITILVPAAGFAAAYAKIK